MELNEYLMVLAIFFAPYGILLQFRAPFSLKIEGRYASTFVKKTLIKNSRIIAFLTGMFLSGAAYFNYLSMFDLAIICLILSIPLIIFIYIIGYHAFRDEYSVK